MFFITRRLGFLSGSYYYCEFVSSVFAPNVARVSHFIRIQPLLSQVSSVILFLFFHLKSAHKKTQMCALDTSTQNSVHEQKSMHSAPRAQMGSREHMVVGFYVHGF